LDYLFYQLLNTEKTTTGEKLLKLQDLSFDVINIYCLILT